MCCTVSLLTAVASFYTVFLHSVRFMILNSSLPPAVFNLEKTFKMTFSLLVLHMWLCLSRLKVEGKEGVELGQYVYEIYNHDVEMRVSKAGVCNQNLYVDYIMLWNLILFALYCMWESNFFVNLSLFQVISKSQLHKPFMLEN